MRLEPVGWENRFTPKARPISAGARPGAHKAQRKKFARRKRGHRFHPASMPESSTLRKVIALAVGSFRQPRRCAE
jgi:hypothetical protein